jgi:hypothetical protein
MVVVLLVAVRFRIGRGCDRCTGRSARVQEDFRQVFRGAAAEMKERST